MDIMADVDDFKEDDDEMTSSIRALKTVMSALAKASHPQTSMFDDPYSHNRRTRFTDENENENENEPEQHGHHTSTKDNTEYKYIITHTHTLLLLLSYELTKNNTKK